MSSAASNSVGGADLRIVSLGEVAAPAPEPLARVFALGDRAENIGAIIGLVLALLTHGYASVRAMTALFDMQHAVGEIRAGMHEFFWTEYDIDLPKEEQQKPKEEEKPPEPPPPEPEPVPVPKEPSPVKEEDPYDPPPAPAQAAKVLTQDPDPDEPVDMTGQGFVTGDGTGPGFGMVSAAGTAKTPTFDRNASLSGKEGGKGTGSNTPPPVEGPDLSKAPGLQGSASWDCPFPPEADAEQIDFALVSVSVTVRPDGSVQSVKVLDNGGNGFGREARLCVLARKFTPALDRQGQPTTGVTTVRIRFTR